MLSNPGEHQEGSGKPNADGGLAKMKVKETG